MQGLTIGEKHTYRDFGLRMLSCIVSPPEPRIEEIDIPGRGVPLDVSEFFGEIIYKPRTLTAVFDMEEPSMQSFLDKFSKICNGIHGLSSRIILDAEPAYYYEGRVKVSYTKKNSIFYEITISADVAPYKMRVEETSASYVVSGELKIYLENERKSVIPSIVSDSEFRLVFGQTSVVVPAGEHKGVDLKLTQGTNALTCYGTGNITFIYQEGSL